MGGSPCVLYRLSAGSVGPAYYGLGMLDAFYVIILVDIMCVAPISNRLYHVLTREQLLRISCVPVRYHVLRP